MNNIKRLGFACKWIDGPSQINGIKQTDTAKKYNTGTTTVAWLKRQSKDVAEQKLWDLITDNVEATRKLIEKVGKLDDHLRMVRISSDILPVYTHNDWSYFYRKTDVLALLQQKFNTVGDIARNSNVRLSFHPGQFCVLASDRSEVVERSIEEFEYHVDMARWMGYGKTFQDMKINVHIAGKAGPQGFLNTLKRLSPEARNTITIENEEMKHGLDDCLSIADHIPVVLDIHHHWIREGEYISPEDDRVKRVIESWRGVRPTCHFSVSREDILVGHDPYTAPNHSQLLLDGYKKGKLRAHSNFYWNKPVNKWALSFLKTHDIMCESKAKNLASFALAEQAKVLTLL